MVKDKRVSRGNTEKLYVQLYKIMKEMIISGRWPAGTLVPSEKDLCRIYGISSATVKTAIFRLVSEGFLIRIQGKGTFVKKRSQASSAGNGASQSEEILYSINNPLAIIGEKAGWLQDLLEEEKDRLKNYKEYQDVFKKIRLQINRMREAAHKMTDLPKVIEEIKKKRNNNGKSGA